MHSARKPGYYKTLAKFMSELRTMQLMTGHGEVEPHWKVFETFDEAFEAYDLLWVLSSPESRELGRQHHACIQQARTLRTYDYDVTYEKVAKQLYRNFVTSGFGIEVATRANVKATEMVACIAAWNDPSHPYTQYITSLWRVWEKGFGLIGDVRGSYYVYRRF